MSIPSSDFPTSSGASSSSGSSGGMSSSNDPTVSSGGGGESGGISSAASEAMRNPQATIDRLAQAAHDTIDRLAGRAGPAVERMKSSLSGTGDKLHGRADALMSTRDEWMESCRTTVREHPMAAVGTALLAGWLVGRLTRD